jgi:Domain of unknown function (DUF4878)
MKKILAILATALILFGCNNANTSSPTNAANAFLDAMKKGDETAFKSMLSKNDLAIMEAGEKMAKELGVGDATTKKLKDEFIQKAKNATYAIKNEKVDGDKATVDVEVKDEEGTHNQQFNLVKENGAWKVSLFNGDKGGFDVAKMKEATDSLKAVLKDVNMDSAVNSMKELFKDGAKSKQKLEELSKKMEEASKEFEKKQ